jgi:glutamate racemase
MTARRPCIGVFDSGFGGLTVLRQLLRLIPKADYLYFGDTARLPYGSKSAETVAKYAVGAMQFLEQRGADFGVIACNTASALALDRIVASVSFPVVGVVEPGAECAAANSKTGKVVVVATDATVNSHAYARALHARRVETREKACPLLVPLVEEGWIEHPVTEQVASIYLNEAFRDGFSTADVLVLGCTHYPLLKPVLQRVAPPHVRIVDSAESTAETVAGRLTTYSNTSSEEERRAGTRTRFFATDSVDKFKRLGAQFLGHDIETVTHAELKE